MNMTISTLDAFNILGITSQSVTQAEITKAYEQAVNRYHPDRNPAGLEMMKLINGAYERLKVLSESIEASPGKFTPYGERVNEALNAILSLELTIKICGAWVWLSGDDKRHVNFLSEKGFRWSCAERQWCFGPNL